MNILSLYSTAVFSEMLLITTRLHGVIFQKTMMFLHVAVRNSTLILSLQSLIENISEIVNASGVI